MNPFNLPGPQFLLFYSLFSLAVVMALAVLRRRQEPVSQAGMRLTDPYAMALLRGGGPHAMQTAAVALIDRGLLKAEGGKLTAAEGARPPSAELERALMAHFNEPREASSIFTDAGVKAACEHYERQLAQLGLLPGPEQKAARNRLLLAGLAALWGVAFIKIVVAFSRGRFNVIFLILLSIAAAVVAAVVTHPRVTRSGAALMSHLRTLFTGLKERAASLRPGGGGDEAALLVALFGIAALPTIAYPDTRKLFPRAAQNTGSSCGSIMASSCGSSCGGGGCGGGCGGCGG